MALYKVTIGYRTKRGGVALGMVVDAFGPDEAVELARDKTLKGYPARRFAFSEVREADAAEAKLHGVVRP